MMEGERRGVARGSVRRMSWIAASSSEITLALVGVGVGRQAKSLVSRGDALVLADKVEGGEISGRF